jgi:hypothetical protein
MMAKDKQAVPFDYESFYSRYYNVYAVSRNNLYPPHFGSSQKEQFAKELDWLTLISIWKRVELDGRYIGEVW